VHLGQGQLPQGDAAARATLGEALGLGARARGLERNACAARFRPARLALDRREPAAAGVLLADLRRYAGRSGRWSGRCIGMPRSRSACMVVP
jgi:hypothetical protein